MATKGVVRFSTLGRCVRLVPDKRMLLEANAAATTKSVFETTLQQLVPDPVAKARPQFIFASTWDVGQAAVSEG
jgi:hypothetical protein